MALAIALLLLSPLASDVDKLCFTLGVLKYYAFLSSFVWVTCVTGDTWWTLRRSQACQPSPEDGSDSVSCGICWSGGYYLRFWQSSYFLLIYRKQELLLLPNLGDRVVGLHKHYPSYCFFFVPVFVSVTLDIGFSLLTVTISKTAFQ